jgi:hypothetical protein
LIPDDFFNIIIDKACIDCILSDSNSQKAEDNFISALKEIEKVMTSDGIFYYFSTANPEKRVPLLSKVFGKNLEIEEISIYSFIYSYQF